MNLCEMRKKCENVVQNSCVVELINHMHVQDAKDAKETWDKLIHAC